MMLTNPVNLGFFAAMLIMAVVDAVSAVRRGSLDYRGAIVSTGVLGTFVGVFIGLQGFDTNNLRESVPSLLEGMKTAFATSILGMGLSIILTVLFHRAGEAESEQQALIKTIERESEKSRQAMEVHFEQTQLKLQQAIEGLSQNASDQLVASLESVVKAFNENLTEQFGENFKALNDAVGRLLVWQENYRDLVDADRALIQDIERAHEQIIAVLQQTGRGHADVQNSLDNLVPVLNQLSEEARLLERHRTQLSKSGEALSETLDKLHHVSANVSESLDQQTTAVSRLSAEMSRQLPATLGTLEESLTGLTNRFAKDYEGFLKHYRELIDRQG
ncbi:MAG: hypothetical protein HWE20_04590 [Gammaproteobacteria bacterium]|nr:hypothetical protein [Gammaproteobacteria bacterium]